MEFLNVFVVVIIYFHQRTLFNSGTGWSSFFAPINKENVELKLDAIYGMNRIEEGVKNVKLI
jgi:peptide methionine sulfoxide reductase MsrB